VCVFFFFFFKSFLLAVSADELEEKRMALGKQLLSSLFFFSFRWGHSELEEKRMALEKQLAGAPADEEGIRMAVALRTAVALGTGKVGCLYSTVLDCIVLYSTVMYCTVLYCIVQ